MAVNPSAFGPKPQFELSDGTPAVGGRLFFYVAGSVGTKQNTYTDSTGGSANTNPVVLNALGTPTTEIWWTAGLTYKVVYAPPGSDDPPNSPVFTVDNLRGINDTTNAVDQWLAGPTPTFVSTTSFTLVGDQTSTFTVDRRIKTTNTGGTIFSTITASVFGAVTTVTVVNDSGVLDAGLSAVSYGIVSPTNTSLPPNLGIFTTKGDTISAAAVGRGVRLAVGSDGQAYSADSTQTGGTVWVDNPSRPNLLTNPNWQIDQINEGALYTVNTTDVRGPDGWSGTEVGTGVFKMRTLADPDNAALKCLEISCTTADVAIAAADDYFIYTAIEGYDFSSLMAGTSAAATITVQFKFKSNVSGVYGVSVANSALNRRYVGIVTVADASEHEYSVSLTLDTTGTWLYTNGVGCYLRLCLAAGSNFQATAGAWAAGAEQTTSAQCNFMSANTNIAYLKRVQLIPGSLVQAYRAADFQKELAKAQRQYIKTWNQGVAVGTVTDAGTTKDASREDAQFFSHVTFPVTMRATPTATVFSPASGASGAMRNTSTAADVACSFSDVGMSGVNLFAVGLAAARQQGSYHGTFNARLS